MGTPRIKGLGFSTLEGGVDGGKDPSLIALNQVASASNVSMRGALVTTRNPFSNILFEDMTGGRFTGRFQGSMFYSAESGNSGFILSVGGKLFRFQFGTPNTISEITPKLSIVTTAPFAVPGIGLNVTVDVTSETVLTPGMTVIIDSGQYLIISQFLKQVLIEYLGGAANATAPQGSIVLDVSSQPIFEYQTNPANADIIFMFQAENYAIILGGQNRTIIYDGAISRQAGISELPPAVIGVYAWGRIWLTFNDRRRFIAGDIVYGPSGTPQNGFRDAILKVTENDFLNEGGAFSVPNNAGLITSMFPATVPDTSLGIGPILIGCTNSVVSCNAPVDRTTWKNLTYPIQTISLLDYGPIGPWSFATINADVWYRALNEIRSFIVARRDMNMLGPSPVSREVAPILTLDSKELLEHCSAVYFDNRLLMTVNPYLTQYGTAHRGLVVINYDLVSDLKQKSPPSWEGSYSGLKFLQMVKGLINKQERAFAFALNQSSIEIWEFQTTGYYDKYTIQQGSGTRINSTSIQSFIETRKDDFGNNEQLKRLYTAEVFLQDIVDDIEIKISYRPDEYPEYAEWFTIRICAGVSQCLPPQNPKFICQVWKTKRGTYAARVMLTTPTEVPNLLRGGFLSSGYTFQFKFESTGRFTISKFKPQATMDDDKSEGEASENKPCVSFSSCESDFFAYSSYGMNVEYSATALIPNGASNGVVTGLNLGFTPSTIDISVITCDLNSEVLVVNATDSLSADGFTYSLSGATDGPCYKISYTLKM